MRHLAYYHAAIPAFLMASSDAILGELAKRHSFALDLRQKGAWLQQISILKEHLNGFARGAIFFEFGIPRMGKRADVVVVIDNLIFVIEFKVGSNTFDRSAIEQVHDYALDLKNFHQGSHQLPIVPILVATEAPRHETDTPLYAEDQVAVPLCVSSGGIAEVIRDALAQRDGHLIDIDAWLGSGYQPTPTIIQAAQTLYRTHDVSDIARSDAGAVNLKETSDCISGLIERSKEQHRHAICFVTGVPGAGKTLAGLNVAAIRAEEHKDENAVFLSGNGPLVVVLREALARDQASREGVSKKDAHRKVASFVQNIHHFRDDALRSDDPPHEKVVIFDEAQRAWSREQASSFMRTKRGHLGFDMSEPEFLIEVMDRHADWCVIICLVGGGQEINTGEAGLTEWLSSIANRFKHWDIYLSNRLEDPDYVWDRGITAALEDCSVTREDALHLGVSMRSFRAEALSGFVGHIVENRPEEARRSYAEISDRYPIFLTRDVDAAREWLRHKSRGSERFGLIASSGAHRLRPEGIHIKAKVDPAAWFLNDRSDVRSSFYLEEVATEFDIQGLELDWTGICWDADFRYENGNWGHYSFRGSKWQKVKALDRQLYLKNAYRVILTRARQGMAIAIPKGNIDDPTRPPAFYDETYEYLQSCGLKASF